MATSNDSYSLPVQPVTSYPLSILDLFFPGLNGISAAVRQLQAGSSDSYAGILCICGMLVFLGKYFYKHVREVVMTYFSSYRPKLHRWHFLTTNSFNHSRL